VRILHRDRPGLEIDRQAKSYRVEAAMGGYKSPLMMVENLGAFRGTARQELGRKQISGSDADGIVLELRDIDPSAGPGAVELWVDADTKLPVLIEIRQTVGMPLVMRMDDFEWNVELDDALFDATPPTGFTNTSRPPEDQKDFVEKIKAALKLYSELSGGSYPRGTMIYGDVTRDEMLGMSGLKGPIQQEWLRDKRYERVLLVTGGLARANSVLRDNSDAAYHGAEVGPRDAEKVLLRWRLDDGTYQVIYGDLSDGVVGRERLQELER
jgi:hypothetical protein